MSLRTGHLASLTGLRHLTRRIPLSTPLLVHLLSRQCERCCRMANLAAVPTMIALSSAA